ncbi:MAG: winged helix-turn-helix transcriptional regulator [Chitinophagales bacterium]
MRNDKCTVLSFTVQLGGKWKLPIINAIRKNKTLRFGKLHQIVDGVSRKVLTEQLKALESDGLIIRRQFEEIPPRVEYSLTKKSEGLCEVFQAIDKWSLIEDK